jgi:hypothetical protein
LLSRFYSPAKGEVDAIGLSEAVRDLRSFLVEVAEFGPGFASPDRPTPTAVILTHTQHLGRFQVSLARIRYTTTFHRLSLRHDDDDDDDE